MRMPGVLIPPPRLSRPARPPVPAKAPRPCGEKTGQKRRQPAGRKSFRQFPASVALFITPPPRATVRIPYSSAAARARCKVRHQSAVEAAACPTRVKAAAQSLRHFRKHRPGVRLQQRCFRFSVPPPGLTQRQSKDSGLGSILRGFKAQRSLPLVGHTVAQTTEGGRSVEQTSATGSEGAVQLPFPYFPEHGATGRQFRTPRRKNILFKADMPAQGCGAAPGFACGGIAPGQQEGAQPSQTPPASFGGIDQQKFPAPDAGSPVLFRP